MQFQNSKNHMNGKYNKWEKFKFWIVSLIIIDNKSYKDNFLWTLEEDLAKLSYIYHCKMIGIKKSNFYQE